MKTNLAFLLLFLVLPAAADIRVMGNKILVKDEPNFERKLETRKFQVDGREAHLSETGFIVSSAVSSFENDRFISRWVSLDERVIRENQINLGAVEPVKGSAYGIMFTSQDFAQDLKTGQFVRISRYGLKGDHFMGRVLRINVQDERDLVQVHFIANNAHELIAGTTCEVEVPHVRRMPYKVSLLSLLHLGLEDYIVVKESDGVYFPKHVTIIDQDSETATILVPVSKDLQYVARGAILLKPLLNEIVTQGSAK